MAVLLVDTVRSMALRGRLGQNDFDFLMAAEYATLRACVRRAGGSGAQSLGDGLMAWFPSAVTALDVAAAMHDAVAALATERDVAELAVRVVVALGDVRIIDGELRGLAPVVVSRLEKLVPAGATFCTDAVRLAATGRGDHTFDRRPVVELPGVPDPVSVWSVGRNGQPGVAADDEPPLGLWRPRRAAVDDLWGT